jgi:hypothetical protein
MSQTLHIWVSGNILESSDANNNFSIVDGLATEALAVANAASGTAATAISEAQSVTSALPALSATLASAEAQVVSGGSVVSAAASEAASALAIAGATASTLSGMVAEMASATSVSSSAESLTVSNGGTISTISSTASSALTSAGSAQSAANAAAAAVVAFGATVSALTTSAASVSSSAAVASSTIAAAVSSAATLVSGVVPLSEMPYTAGAGITISGGVISTSGGSGGSGGTGTPDVYCFFGGAANATTGEYSFGIRASHGIASVSHTATGCYTIVFSTPFANADYVACYQGSFGGDPSGATSGDTTTWDNTIGVVSEHRGGEYPSRSTTQIILSTSYMNGNIVNYDLARICLAIWNAPTGNTITTSGSVSSASS